MRTRALLVIFALVLTAACSDSDNNNSSAPPLLDEYVLSSDDSVPEGVAFDPQERSFYTTSLQGGGIVRIDASGREFVFRTADNRARLVGAKVDSQRRRLWVCAQQVDGLDNRVWVFDLASANLTLEFLLGALTTNGSCNDLVLDSSGAAYVTDPANPNVYRLDPATGNGEILITDSLLADVTGAGLGLNGIALSPDESVLIVARYVPATLLRIDLPHADTVEVISLSGDTLPAPDGLAVLDEDLYAVSATSVSRVRFNSDFSEAAVVNVAQRSGLSTATVAESRLYVIKSDVVNYVLQLPLDTPFEVFRVDTAAFEL